MEPKEIHYAGGQIIYNKEASDLKGARVGETMFWPAYKVEERALESDEEITFTLNKRDVTVSPKEGSVALLICDNVPDGWHALDGSAELPADEYKDLAAFMPGNVTTDGKIWLPYVMQKIIKIKY